MDSSKYVCMFCMPGLTGWKDHLHFGQSGCVVQSHHPAFQASLLFDLMLQFMIRLPRSQDQDLIKWLQMG